MIALVKSILRNNSWLGKPARRFRNWYNANLKYGIRTYGKNFQCNRGLVVLFNDVRVGDDVFIGYNCYLGVRNILIGNYVQLAPQVVITGADHRIDIVGTPIVKTGLEDFRDVQTNQQGVTIEDDVWVGFGAIIMDGVTIGEGSVVGAGSVVTSDVPPYSIYAGIPAKKIRDRFDNLDDRIEHSRSIHGSWHKQLNIEK